MKKKLGTLLLAVILCFASTLTVLAETPEVEKKTVTFTVGAAEENSTEDGIEPYMWDLKDEHLDSQNIMNTDTFPITDRFFAFEMVGRDEAGNPVNGDYRVSLMYPILVDKVRCISPVDGKIYKADWITMEPGDYLFQIQNYTNVKLRITVTYYSWN